MNEELAKKLDILIKLVASSVIKDDSTQTESILKLNKIGIGYKDIANIMGASNNYVALIMSKNKKNNENKK